MFLPGKFPTRTTISLFVFGLVIVAITGCGSGNSSTNSNLVGTNSVPSGAWGNVEAAVELDISGSRQASYSNVCGTVNLNGTVTPNSNGDVIVTGPIPSGGATEGEYVGHAQNGTIHLIVVNTYTQAIAGSFDLTYGVKGKVPAIGCP